MQGRAAGQAALLLAAMLFLAPALGVPHEEILQDTFKSALVALLGLGAALWWLWRRPAATPLAWHPVLLLPLLPCAWALGSMAWSHAWLAAGEAVRWFLFAVLLALGLNVLERERVTLLAWGIHAGAVAAAAWAVLQFLFDIRIFPQGPNPGSTFVNRNFFAEFAACALPFTVLLMTRVQRLGTVAHLAMGLGIVVTALLMAGTRSALAALWLQLLLVLPLAAWALRPAAGWDRRAQGVAVATALATVLALGLLPTGNASLAAEGRGLTALERGLQRTRAIDTADPSLALRMDMWGSTLRMVGDHPLAGVGAGSWENLAPLYQPAGATLETDYHAHNEPLQLVAEYGVAGWLVLALLVAYLARAEWITWRHRRGPEAGLRTATLASLMALLVVSNAGFPWHMATTAALFALGLAILAASDLRLGQHGQWVACLPAARRALVAGTALALVLAAVGAAVAVASESRILRATRMALALGATGQPDHPSLAPQKEELLRLLREGITLNPHNRKITPMVADELARQGDWKNATWIWDSVLASRPNVVALQVNAARGHALQGELVKALDLLERARRIQPEAVPVRSLEVVLLARTGREPEALQAARAALAAGAVDHDLATSAFLLARRAGDRTLAEQAMGLRLQRWPQTRVEGLLELGAMRLEAGDRAGASAAFRHALEAAPASQREAVRKAIPPGTLD